ncbi:armadillo-type protein [Myxozyma melibiosi]|uniref:Armadillo-type protein n=1 Tax=Myxozyma melibiosi TaxID=54550 RepID=A0ABR1FEE5_9ASCO
MPSSYAVGSTVAIQPLLEKLSSEDSDYRFMSLSDLHGILANKTVSLANDSVSTINRIIDGVLKSLSDNNAEVQNLAVKCLAPLVSRVNETQLANILNRLSAVAPSDSDRSLNSTALRTIISNVPATASTGKMFVARLLHTLLPNLRNSTESVEVLVELVNRFGSSLTEAQIEETQNALIGVFETGKGLVRKRAVSALGALSRHLPTPLWENMVLYLTSSFASSASPDRLRILVLVCGTLCRADRARLGPYLPKLAPSVFKALEVDDDDLREAALSALDTFVVLCPLQMAQFNEEVVAAGSKFIKYDPNYAADEDEEMVDGDDASDLSDEDNEDDDAGSFDDDYGDEFSDDDDVSWKLRRGAAKLLASLIPTLDPEAFAKFYGSVAQLLVSRFSEREDTVRIEVISAFAVLVSQTARYTLPRTSSPNPSLPLKRSIDDVEDMIVDGNDSSAESGGDPRVRLTKLSGRVFKLLARHLQKTPNLSTKQACLTVATELMTVLASLPTEFGAFVPALEQSMAQTALRMDVIKFIETAAVAHGARGIDGLEEYLPKLVSIVLTAADDKFYKIASEALFVANALVKTLALESSSSPAFAQCLDQIHEVAVQKATGSEIDLVVRENAILSVVSMMTLARGSLSASEFATDSAMLFDRLKNETTRQVAIGAIEKVFEAPSITVADFSEEWVTNVAGELASLLRKADRELRMSALTTLKVVIEKFAASVSTETVVLTVNILLGVLMEENLQFLAPSLAILATLVPRVDVGLQTENCNSAIELVSKQISASAVKPLLSLLDVLSKCGHAKTLFSRLNQGELMLTVMGAKALAVVIVSGGLEAEQVPRLKSVIGSPDASADSVRGVLMVLGEIVAVKGDSGSADLVPIDLLFGCFSDQRDEVRVTAAQTLGVVAARHVSEFLPVILERLVLEPGSVTARLLVIALNEVTVFCGAMNEDESGALSSRNAEKASALAAYAPKIWTSLFSLDLGSSETASAANEKDSVKTVIGECVGRLALMSPKKFIPDLQSRLVNGDAQTRSIVISAVRFIFSQPKSSSVELVPKMSEYLRPLVGDFFALLEDPDLDNRRLVVTAVAAVARNYPSFLATTLAHVLELLFANTVPQEGLIREVQMGPFKHKVDDGLDVRKAAYDSIYAILLAYTEIGDDLGTKVAKDDLKLDKTVERAMDGLKDDHDIKVVSCLMLGRVAHLDYRVIISHLDDLAKAFTATLTIKLKDNTIKQEIEKTGELQRRVAATTRAIQTALDAGDGDGGSGSVLNVAWEKYLKEVFAGFSAGAGEQAGASAGRR